MFLWLGAIVQCCSEKAYTGEIGEQELSFLKKNFSYSPGLLLNRSIDYPRTCRTRAGRPFPCRA